MKDIAGLILAGGGSTRMGVPKLDLPWREESLLSRIAGVMTNATEEVWLVGCPERTRISLGEGLRFMQDELRIGPLGGILLGLQAVQTARAIITAADMPFVETEAIRRLAALSHGAAITVLRTSDGLHPLFGVYHRSCLPAIRDAIGRGQRHVTCFWRGLSPRILDVGDDPYWNRTLFNINSLEDYHLACLMRDESPEAGSSRVAKEMTSRRRESMKS